MIHCQLKKLKRNKMKKIFSVLLISAVITSSIFSQELPDPYSPFITKQFADSLFQDGFLSEAEGEYKRYIFTEQNTSAISIQASLTSLCDIYKLQDNKTGINWLYENFLQDANSSLKEKIILLKAETLFLEQNKTEFDLFANEIFSETTGDRPLISKDLSYLLSCSNLLLNNDISQMTKLCSKITEQSKYFERLNLLCASYKEKNPFTASIMSMFVPGSGKWYTGSFPAFVSSFLSISSFALGTYFTGTQYQWKSWQPYVLGACGAVLYITDIYGSYQSAKRYNNALYQHLCQETQKIYEELY